MKSKVTEQLASPKSSKTRKSPRLYSLQETGNPDQTEQTSKGHNRCAARLSNKSKHDKNVNVDTRNRHSINDEVCASDLEEDNSANLTAFQLQSKALQSPRQTVRRKIFFKPSTQNDEKTSNNQDLLSFLDDESETEIPRRKKLRSEMTEDELWEGFPQIVRFKRLTPQKSQISKMLTECSATVIDGDVETSVKHGGENKFELTEEKETIPNIRTAEIVPTKSRNVVNIFNDFSKVFNENNKVFQTHIEQTPNKRKSKLTPKRKNVNITPKRSARLQEKRESPSVQKHADFVYTLLKKENSNEKIKIGHTKIPINDKSGSRELTENSESFTTLSDNEATKKLYKITVAQDHKSEFCDLVPKSTLPPENSTIETLTPMDFQNEGSESDDTVTVTASCSKTIKSENNISDYQSLPDTTINVKATIYELLSHLVSKIEIVDKCDMIEKGHIHDSDETGSSVQDEKSEDKGCITGDHESDRKANFSYGSPEDVTDPAVENFLPELQSNFSEEKDSVDLELLPSNQTDQNDIKIASQKSALKLRIRRHGEGKAEIVYSGTTNDHAYVLSLPGDKSSKKNSKEGDGSNNARFLRKKFLQDKCSVVTRRSPRVANASSSGKGPGMGESITTSQTDITDSTQTTFDCNKSTREKSKKKQSLEEEQLLKNNRVEKYACMLWSSEQRRHFQQLHRDSSIEEVDNLMRKAWENLDTKDKLRYFTRASNALKDENKHSNAKLPLAEEEAEEERPPCPAMTLFLSLSTKEQDDELKRWLKFFYEVSPNEYAKLKTLEKAKIKRDELKSKSSKTDPLQYYRQVLYQSILDAQGKITEIYEQKKKKQQEIVKEAFGTIVKRLITGTSTEELKFSRDVVSKKLAEVLLDLQYLENERKVGVSGSPVATKSYENLLDNLKTNVKADVESEWGLEQDEEDENDFSQELLDKVSEEDLPLLGAETVEQALQSPERNETNESDDDLLFSSEIYEQLSSIFEQQARKEMIRIDDDPDNIDIRSPANVLSNWVLADQLKVLSRCSYNSMYSLLEHKHFLPFLKEKECSKERRPSYTSLNKPDISNNNTSKTKADREKYQAKIDRLCYQRPTQVPTCYNQGIRIVEASGFHTPHLQQIRPALPTPHTMVRRQAPSHGHTFVKFTTQPIGRCRIFSVRQTR